MVYFIILGYSKQIDDKYKTHLYPSYLTSYNLNLGGDGFGLQSGLHDALKFTKELTADIWKAKAEEIFGERKEFEIVPIDSRILGRDRLRYVVN